ncbi:MAG: DNA polymerase [Methanothrix sp.]
MKIILENAMTFSPPLTCITKAESWESALQEIEKYGICSLNLLTTGQDPLSHEITLISLALPNNTTYIADCLELGKTILSDLAGLLENKRIKKVLYNALPSLAFIRASENRKLDACNLFDLMLASQICWSGYYYLTPSHSPKNPNAQQIPRKGDDATAIRRLFLPEAGKRFVKADFSAIELRIMAFISGDRAMQEAFREGVDLHRLTACKISGADMNQVTDSQRQAAKIMNFLLIYGGSAKTLQWRVLSDYGRFISLDEAEEAKTRFFQTYEGVRVWQERQLQEMSYTVPHYFHNCIQGYFFLPLTCTKTALGRRRIWPRFGTGIRASKFQMYNTPCQGTGADLIKLVMCEVYDKISSEDARIIGSIHDEILLEVPEERAEEYARMLQEIMERIGSQLLHPVPVKVVVKILSSLGE